VVTSDGDGHPVDLNAWFDRLPTTTFDVGARRVPAFRSLGIVGFHVALVTAVLAGMRTGTPLVTTLGLSAVAGLSFFAWGHLRRAVTGVERLVLVEYVWVALACVAAFLWASGVSGDSRTSTLDVFAVAVCPFLAFGRLGCLVVGCCHGVAAPVGVRYGPGHHLPARLEHRRLLPVPLVESVALVGIGAVGLVVAGRPPGAATVWFLAAYAVLRFGLERLRGDHRPAVLRVPVAKAVCVAQLGVAVALSEAWLVPGPPGRATVVGAAALGVALVAGLALSGSRADPLASPRHQDDVWRIVSGFLHEVAPGSPVATAATPLGVIVGVSDAGDGWFHVSLSDPVRSTFGLGLALSGDPVLERNGVTHLRLRLVPDTLEAATEGAGATAPTGPEDGTVRAYFARPGAA
jgi:hypothetical protein